jgi:hypothetical protein
MTNELKILQALQDEKPEAKNVETTFQITRGAYRKAHLLAKIVSRIAGGGMECYGYQLKPADALDDTVRDVYFAPGQDNQAAYVSVTPEGVYQAGQEAAARNYELLGWWHSHGSFGTFHSGTDVNNFEVILHSIAPQTMFRKEEPVFVREGDTLLVDNYSIRGVGANPSKIIKKVERDPFAYSMVVNDHNEQYLECRTKIHNPDTGEFDLQDPTHPRLTVVDDPNDPTRLDVADLEWEVRQKVRINGGANTDRAEPCEGRQYRIITSAFTRSGTAYVKAGGKYSDLVSQMMLGDANVSRYELLRDGKEGRVAKLPKTLEQLATKDEMWADIEARLRRGPFEHLQDPNTKYRRFELENLITAQCMVAVSQRYRDYEGGQFVRETDKAIERAMEKSQTLDDCAKVAAAATGALSRYAMLSYTDYKKERPRQYETLVANVLAHLATENNHPFLDAVKHETSKQGSQGRIMGLFLIDDRINIANQLIKDLYYMRTGKCNSEYKAGTEKFLMEFPKAYESDPARCDKLIEEHLLSMGADAEQFPRYQSIPEQPVEHEPKSIARYLVSLLPRWKCGRA